jgi:hypothetical protein
VPGVRRLAAVARRLRRLAGDEEGATLATTAILLLTLLGVVGMGIDVGAAFTARRAAQNAADSAALSAAVDAAAQGKQLDQQAKAVAAQYGLVDGKGGVSVQVHTPPTLGPNAGNGEATEVIIQRPALGFFSLLFNPNPPPIRARAVATSAVGDGSGCLLALDPKAAQAVLFNGVPTVNLQDCSLYDNSNSSTALLLNGGVTINATGIDVVGGILKNGSVKLNANVQTGAKPQLDPYAKVPIPPYSGCDQNSAVVNSGSRTFNASGPRPYVFCNGLIVNGGSVNFGPGVYVINGGSFILNGSTGATATGATFIFTNGATFTFNSGTNINMSAPTTGPTKGMLLWVDPKGGGGQVTLNAGSNQAYTGAIYAPSRQLVLNGGTRVVNSACTQIIAATMIINGDVALQTDCAGTGVTPIGSGAPHLIE